MRRRERSIHAAQIRSAKLRSIFRNLRMPSQRNKAVTAVTAVNMPRVWRLSGGSLHPREEVADDAVGIPHAQLNMILIAEPCSLVERLALDKKATDRLIRFEGFLVAHSMECLDHGTVQLSVLECFPPIGWHLCFCLSCGALECLIGNTHRFEVLDIQQIEAVSQIDHRTEHGGMLDPCALMCPLVGTLVAVFPEIDPVAQPVVVVATHPEILFPRENVIKDRVVASVVTEHKAIPRHDGWDLLSVSLFELAGWCDDSDPLEKGTRRGAVFVNFLSSSLDGLSVPESLSV
jgi:hypothetical protein